MDNLLFKFDQATDLELDQNNPSRFNNLYKNNDKLIKKQQQRRNEILSNRLCKRDKLMASIRRLVSDVNGDEDNEDLNVDENNSLMSTNLISNNKNETNVKCTHENRIDDDSDDLVFSEMPSSTSTTNSNHISSNLSSTTTKINKSGQVVEDRKFRNKAMLSEWLVDRPMDFETEWVLKATPVGRRCLVFARKGETVAYSRTGQFIKAFQSSLPGGCHMNTAHCRRQFAIVDCIYVHNRNSFYMMDALAWNEHKLYESEASFRFFWLQSRYNEAQDRFQLVNSRNECRFYCLNTYPASNQDILRALNNDSLIREHNLQLDGLLFFHVRGPYVPGSNPLVLWIKPEMANRVLDMSSSKQ